MLSWSVSVSSKLDDFFILLVFFCGEDDRCPLKISHRSASQQTRQNKPASTALSEEKARENSNLALGEAPDEGAAGPFVAAWIGLVGRVGSVLTFTLRRRRSVELFVSDVDSIIQTGPSMF